MTVHHSFYTYAAVASSMFMHLKLVICVVPQCTATSPGTDIKRSRKTKSAEKADSILDVLAKSSVDTGKLLLAAMAADNMHKKAELQERKDTRLYVYCMHWGCCCCHLVACIGAAVAAI
jgi:hypothetical protein